MYAYSPKGTLIVGTLEVVTARCSVHEDLFERDAAGRLMWEYDGNGADMFWDEMRPVEHLDQTVFLDENGDQWTDHEITLSTAEPPAPTPPAARCIGGGFVSDGEG